MRASFARSWPFVVSGCGIPRLDVIHRYMRILPTSAMGLVGSLLLEQIDKWTLQRRYMQLEGLQSLSDTASPRLSAVTC